MTAWEWLVVVWYLAVWVGIWYIVWTLRRRK